MCPRRVIRYGSLEAVPEPMVAELVHGIVYASPRPAPRHALASSEIGHDLISPFRRGRGGPGGWWILDEPELHLGPHVLVPDLAGWRRSTLPELPTDSASFSVPPDWVCEVLSPSTHRLDRLRKLPAYASCGVGYAWLVDPIERTVEVYRRHEDTWILVTVADGDDTAARLEPFHAVALDLTAWWVQGVGPEPFVAEPEPAYAP